MTGIVVVLSGFPRRSETFAVGELEALSWAGVLLGAFATKLGDGLPPHVDAARLAPHVTWLVPGDAAAQAAEIVQALDGRRPAAVHGYFAHTPAAVAQATAAQLGVPFGFSVHARDVRKVAPDALRARARRAAAVVTCNTDVQATLAALDVDAQLVPHGVNLTQFAPAEGAGRATSVRGLTTAGAGTLGAVRPLRLLAVGRLVPKKGFAVLLRALALVRAPFRLGIVGEGPELRPLAALATELGIAEAIDWHGALPHEALPSLYRAADAVLVPSVVDATGDRDGLPNVVLEAMACGRLVIASPAGAITSAVRDEETGWLVPTGDPVALAERIEAVRTRPAVVSRLATAARRFVEREFDGGACARRFVDVLAARYA